MRASSRDSAVSSADRNAGGARGGWSALRRDARGRRHRFLEGELGAGKTLFVRGVAAGLGADPDEVSSPTFSLVNRYGGGRMPLIHLDLYRLEASTPESTARLVGLDELLLEGGVVAIEWPDRLAGLALEETVRVDIAYDGDDARIVTATEHHQNPER